MADPNDYSELFADAFEDRDVWTYAGFDTIYLLLQRLKTQAATTDDKNALWDFVYDKHLNASWVRLALSLLHHTVLDLDEVTKAVSIYKRAGFSGGLPYMEVLLKLRSDEMIEESITVGCIKADIEWEGLEVDVYAAIATIPNHREQLCVARRVKKLEEVAKLATSKLQEVEEAAEDAAEDAAETEYTELEDLEESNRILWERNAILEHTLEECQEKLRQSVEAATDIRTDLRNEFLRKMEEQQKLHEFERGELRKEQ